MTMTRILSIDGGGIRGIIPATVLAEIERRTGRHIADLFDVIAGTSTGGILACGLTIPDATGHPTVTAADLVRMYVDEGPRIFPHEFLGRIRSLVDEKYPQKGIESVLQRYMGDAMLSGTLTELVVTAYDIERHMPFFFRTARARDDARYDFPLRMVARATSAAPSYFEPFLLPAQPDGHYALVDGGVFANNPAMCAYVDAWAGRARRDEVLMVSLGTGSLTRPLPYEKVRDWGLLQWTRPILDVVFDGVSDATDYQLLQILGPENHHRLQVELDVASDAMDDVKPENLHNLVLEGDRLVRDRSDEIDVICARLTEGG